MRLTVGVLLVVLAVAPAAAAAGRTMGVLELGDGMEVTLVDGRRIELRVMPRHGEGYSNLGVRVLGRPGFASVLRRANGGRPLKEGVETIVPWDVMRVEWRVQALAAFFPKDAYTSDGVRHLVRFTDVGGQGETAASIAEWYGGDGGRATALVLPGDGRKLHEGDLVLIPTAALATEFRLLLPAAEAAEPAVATRHDPPAGGSADEAGAGGDGAEGPEGEEGLSPAGVATWDPASMGDIPFAFEDDATSKRAFAFVGDGPLEYRKDDRGFYAAYYLKAGEALYSSVVSRFTGRVFADEVNQLAELIAVRSDIVDVTDIPIGYRVRIPLEYLLPQWLPPGHPERVEWEATRRATSKVPPPKRTKELLGVVVVLDAGHGGEDVGAMANGVWESDYVYDIMTRIKRILEKETAAQVVATIRDREHGFAVFDVKELPLNKAEEIQTTPPYRPVRGAPGVHFRWYLSNYHYQQLTRKGQRPEHVVFTSIHADSLHPSMRGTMVYVPGRDYRTQKFSRANGIYANRREVKAVPVARFSVADLIRSEGLSRQLASQVLAAFSDLGLPVHSNSPIRDHVVRRGRSWVPAVIKYAHVPTSILLEVCNLNNVKDAANIRDPKFRERVARGYVNALRNYYGEAERPKSVEANLGAEGRH